MSADITKYAALIRDKNGKVLFCRKYNKDVWINIGGRVEEGETPIACLKRELQEELGCGIVLDPLPTEFHRTPPTPALDDPEKTVEIIWYEITLDGDPSPNNEIEEIMWVDPKNYEVKLSPQIEEYLIPRLLSANTTSVNSLI